MLAIANEHKAKMEPEVQERVTFRKLDATSASFLAENFDVMYSRDAIMHIADKAGLYTKVFVSFSEQFRSQSYQTFIFTVFRFSILSLRVCSI